MMAAGRQGIINKDNPYGSLGMYMKSGIGSFLADPIAIGITVISIVLMAISMHYNVNPVDGGAMRGGIQYHPIILWTLMITTIPAMWMALLLGGLLARMPDWAPVFWPVVFICQSILGFIAGKMFSFVARVVWKIARKGPQG